MTFFDGGFLLRWLTPGVWAGGRRWQSSVVLLGILGALAVSGCGGEGSDSANASQSKELFVKKANAICRKGSSEFSGKASEILTKADEQPELAQRRLLVAGAIAPTFEREVREIRKLEPPEGGQGQVDAILSAMQRLVSELERDPLSRGTYPYRDVEDLAAGYGLSDCGHP